MKPTSSRRRAASKSPSGARVRSTRVIRRQDDYLSNRALRATLRGLCKLGAIIMALARYVGYRNR